MLLAKSCMNDFNIKNGTIKLGTLYEYRETELQHIADKEEGLLRFDLSFESGVTVPVDVFNTFASPAINIGNGGYRFPGRTNATLRPMGFEKIVGNMITMKKSHATIERHSLNGFIFCMSMVEDPKECSSIFPEYNDSWFLSEHWSRNFGFELGGILREAIINGRNTGNHVIPYDIPLHDISVDLTMGAIKYLPREAHFTSSNETDITNYLALMSDLVFIKPPSPFAKEKEYRFSYTIMSGNRVIEPLVKSIILDSTSLIRFIMQVKFSKTKD